MVSAQLTHQTKTATQEAVRSPMNYARFAGILYIVITIAAIVAHIYVPEQLIIADDAATTAANIATSPDLLRFAIGSEFIVLLSEVVLSIILYVLLKPVSTMISMTAAVSRLIMTAIHGINLLNYYFILVLLSGADYLTVFDTEQINSLVMLFVNAHAYGFAIGIAFLIIHVFALGYLIFTSGYFPRMLGVLFILAGFGYLFDSIGILLVPGYQTTPAIAATVIAVAEIAFPIWLIIRGVNVDGWKKRIKESN